jgi:plastocyanin
MTGESRTLSRRAFVGTAAGGAATVAAGAVASGSATAQEGETHTVDMTDELIFDPDAITVAPGDTIVWENVGAIGHTVTAYDGEIPADAEYFSSGGADSEAAARENYPGPADIPGGERYEHTFEVEGTYEYFCIPHESTGMVGTVTVAPGGGEDGEGGALPVVPGSAQVLAIVATVVLVTVVGLSYVLLKYGGDYEASDD